MYNSFLVILGIWTTLLGLSTVNGQTCYQCNFTDTGCSNPFNAAVVPKVQCNTSCGNATVTSGPLTGKVARSCSPISVAKPTCRQGELFGLPVDQCACPGNLCNGGPESSGADTLSSVLSTVSARTCYQCNFTDTGCSNPFNAAVVPKVQCSTSCGNATATSDQYKGKVARGCSSVTVPVPSCIQGELFGIPAYMCSCNEDLCNGDSSAPVPPTAAPSGAEHKVATANLILCAGILSNLLHLTIL